MIRNRVFVTVSGLITAAFFGVVAYGLVRSPGPDSDGVPEEAAAAQRAGLARAIDGLSRETWAID